MTLLQRAETTSRALKYWLDGTPEIRLTKTFSDRSRMSIDVGANIGQFTWWMRRYAKGVVAYEPNPSLAARLRGSFGEDVVVRQAAASSRSGSANLAIPIGPSGERAAAASLSNSFDEQRTIEVPLERIDELDLGPIGYIKIDVEGHELDVIDGALGTLQRDLPTLLVEIELRHHNGEIGSKIDRVREIGYQAAFLLDGSLRPWSDFRDEMQDPANLGKPSKYINNFIFTQARV